MTYKQITINLYIFIKLIYVDKKLDFFLLKRIPNVHLNTHKPNSEKMQLNTLGSSNCHLHTWKSFINSYIRVARTGIIPSRLCTNSLNQIAYKSFPQSKRTQTHTHTHVHVHSFSV